MAWGAFYLAARQVLVGPERAYHISMERGTLVNTMIRGLRRGWMWWHGVGWWAVAVVAGGLTVVVAGALLRGTQSGWRDKSA
jgi:hypothetical protein